MTIDFLSIGELLVDMISAEYSQSLAKAEAFNIYQGGSPANVAGNLKYLGKNAQLIACVGEDSFGDFLIEKIAGIELSTEYIQRAAKPTTLVIIARSKSTPDFIAYRGADAYMQDIDDEIIMTSKIVHTTSFALSLEPSRQHIIKALSKAADSGKIISIDWNFSPSIWPSNEGVEVFNKIMQLRPYLKVSMDDMDRFFLSNGSPEDYKILLDKYPASFICLTCGKDGVWYRQPNASWYFQEAVPVGQVVDTTGAGDAFWAGFMSAVLENKGIEESISKGLNIASLKVQIQGPLYARNSS